MAAELYLWGGDIIKCKQLSNEARNLIMDEVKKQKGRTKQDRQVEEGAVQMLCKQCDPYI